MKSLLTIAAALMTLATAAFAQEAPKQIVATTPVPRDTEKWWVDRHAAKVELTKQGGLDLVFLGDSITQGWEGDAGKVAWEKYFAPLKAGNFGFSGDRTEHVLWRLANGEIVGLTPKLIVIMIGTNNIGHKSSTPEQTAEGVKAILTVLKEKVPSAKILLLGIFPRDEKPEGVFRQQVAAATKLFKEAADDKTVFFTDIGEKFLQEDGTLSKEIMPDFLHLTEKGYQIWADAIAPEVAGLLKK